MKIREVMSTPAIRINAEESVEVAARWLNHYNIGALPVCASDGRICGLVTDRDLVTRCLAAGMRPGQTPVRDVMSGNVISVRPDMTTREAALLMSQRQVRRLPVVENGKLCGMVSLGDLAAEEEGTARALSSICANVSTRK